MASGADRCALKCDSGQAITPETLGEIVAYSEELEDTYSTRT
jgi:hypothetical protein